MLAPFISKAQVPPYMRTNQKIGTNTSTIYVVGGLWSDSVFNPPARDTLDKPLRAGAMQYSYSAWWGWDGTKWTHFAQDTLFAAQVNSDWTATSGVAFILNKPSFATVAFTGSYTDLINKPTIPAAQVNTDWNATAGISQLLNEPRLVDTVWESATHDTLFYKIRHVGALTTYTLPLAAPGGSGSVDSVSSANIGTIINVAVSSPTLNPHFSYTLQNENINTVWAGPASGGAGPPTFRALVPADIPLLPPTKLTTDTIHLTLGSTGTSPNWSTNFVILGGTETLNLPIANGSDTGLVTPAKWIYWNAKLDSVFHDGTLTGNGTAGSPLHAIGGSGANDTVYVDNGLSALNDSTFIWGNQPLFETTDINTEGFGLSFDSLSNFLLRGLPNKAAGIGDSILLIQSNGQIFKTPLPSGGGGGSITLNNGLTLTGTNGQLGGVLVQSTVVDGQTAFNMEFTSSLSGTNSTVTILNTGTGVGLFGNASVGIGVEGKTTTGSGIFGQATTGVGVTGVATTGLAYNFSTVPVNNNSIASMGQIGRGTSGTAANGIGLSLDMFVQDSSASNYLAGQVVTYWTNVNHSVRTSTVGLTNTLNGVTRQVFDVLGTGQAQLLLYTTSTSFTGTPIANLAVDATGKIIEVASTGSLTFNNGITNTSGTVQLGGTLIQPTTLHFNNQLMTWDLGPFGSIQITGGASGVDNFVIRDTATTGIGATIQSFNSSFGPALYAEGAHNGIEVQADSSGGTGIQILGRGFAIQSNQQAADGSEDNTVISEAVNFLAPTYLTSLLDAVTTGERDVTQFTRNALTGRMHKGSSIGARWQIADNTGLPVQAVQSYVLSDSTNANGTIEWHLNLQRSGSLTNDQFIMAADETTINGSTSGQVVGNEPFRGISYKKVILEVITLVGTATYTFPVGFALTPATAVLPSGVTVSSLSQTAITITGTATNGFVILEGR